MRAAAERAAAWAEAEPGDLEALRECAALSRRVGNFRVAEDALRSLAFFTPHDPEVLNALGEVLTDRGLYDEAREQFQSVIRLDDSSVAAYVGLARLAEYSGALPVEVVSAAQVAMSVGPGDASALTAMGAALNASGRRREARDYLERALTVDATYARALFALGLSHAVLGEREEAHARWREYVELEPETPQAWLLRKNLVVTGTRTLTDRAWYGCYSPDGKRIAYRAMGAGGWGVYVSPADDFSKETRLWATEGRLYSLSWSPDGVYLMTRVYAKTEVEIRGTKREQWVYRLMLIPSDGESEAKPIRESRSLAEPTWIPGTNQIAVRDSVPEKGTIMVAIDRETGESQPLAGLVRQAAYAIHRWSPDGTMWLGVRSSARRADGSYTYELAVAPAAQLDRARAILETPDYVRTPAFSPDGSVILFTRAADGTSGRYPIWAVPADGSREPCLVYAPASPYTEPSISPDSKYLLSCQQQALVRLSLEGISEVE